MPDYNNYIMALALLYNCDKPLTKTEVLNSINKTGADISRDVANYILDTIEKRFALDVHKKNSSKCFYSMKRAGRNAPNPEDTLIPRCLLATAFRAYQQKKGSPDLQKNLKRLFANRKIQTIPDGNTSVYSIAQIEKIVSVLLKQDSISISRLQGILNLNAMEEDCMSKKAVRRAAKEVTELFFAEISGTHEHCISLMPEFKIKLFDFLSPENVLELYEMMYRKLS